MKQYLYRQPDHFAPALVAVGGSVIGEVGRLFGGKPEDTSSVGWQNYIMSRPGLAAYPPITTVERAFKNVVAADMMRSILASYSESDGTIRHGDWNARIDTINPLTIRWFKGAGETFVSRSAQSWSPSPPPVEKFSVPVFGGSSGGFNFTWVIVAVLAVVLGWLIFKR